MDKKIQEAIDILSENEDSLEPIFYENTSIESIDKSEELLEVLFPQDFKDYLKAFGQLDFDGEELYGIVDNDLDSDSHVNFVRYTLELREEYSIPEYFIPVYGNGFGEDYCLNYKELNEVGEPKITAVMLGNCDEYPYEVLYDSFGDFLLDIIDEVVNFDEEEYQEWLEESSEKRKIC